MTCRLSCLWLRHGTTRPGSIIWIVPVYLIFHVRLCFGLFFQTMLCRPQTVRSKLLDLDIDMLWAHACTRSLTKGACTVQPREAVHPCAAAGAPVRARWVIREGVRRRDERQRQQPIVTCVSLCRTPGDVDTYTRTRQYLSSFMHRSWPTLDNVCRGGWRFHEGLIFIVGFSY